jgi:hypothetical protein
VRTLARIVSGMVAGVAAPAVWVMAVSPFLALSHIVVRSSKAWLGLGPTKEADDQRMV